MECVILDVRRVVNRMQFIPGDLSLESQGISIENNLMAVEFAVLNQREFDIVLQDNEFITFRLPEGYSWVTLNVCKCIEAASPQLLKSEERREYRLNISMLKKGDYIVLEGLVDTKDLLNYWDFKRLLHIDYRLAEVGDCNVFVLPEFDKKLARRFWCFLIFFSAALFAFLLLPQFRHPFRDIMYFDLQDSTYKAIMVDYHNQYRVVDNTLHFFSKSRVISQEVLEDRFIPTPIYCEDKTARIMVCVLLVFVLLFLFALVKIMSDYFVRNRVLRTIGRLKRGGFH